MEKEISAKALGLLFEAVCGDLSISAGSLSKYVRDGEKSISSGLRELRDAGLIKTTKEKFNGRFSTKTVITPKGYTYLADYFVRLSKTERFVEFAFSVSAQKSVQKVVPREKANYSVIGNEGFSGMSDFEIQDFRGQEAAEEFERKEHEAQKIQEFVDNAREKRKKKFRDRNTKPKSEWSVTDVSFEFADKLETYWEIPPWRVTETRFTPALGSARKTHGTNGEIEVEMIQLFFDSEQISPKMDPNRIAFRFIYRFPELLSRTRFMAISPEQWEKAERDSEESWKGF